MPKELVALAPRKPALVDYEEPPLKSNQICIKSVFSAEKHGTTLLIYRGLSSFSEKSFDSDTGLFLPKNEGKGWTINFPIKLGNMTVGIVTKVGSQVKKFRVGDRVYGYLPIRETHTVNEDRVNLAPSELSDEEIVCIDPAAVALMAVREGHVRLGDIIAIFGLGAIGLITVQMTKISGAIKVIAVEPIEKRRRLAEKYGVDATIDPTKCDAGLEIKRATDWKGADISIETSGSYAALHHAIRGTRYGGVIVPVSWYHGEAKGLNLGEEWHFNRQMMISGARVESEPYRDYPLWSRKRIYDTVIGLFKRGLIKVDGVISPIVHFKDVVEAYKMLDEKPEEAIKLGVKYE